MNSKQPNLFNPRKHYFMKRSIFVLFVLLFLVGFILFFPWEKEPEVFSNFTEYTRKYVEEKLSRIDCSPSSYYFESSAVCFKCFSDVCFVLAKVDRGKEGIKLNVVGEYVKASKASEKLAKFYYPKLSQCYPNKCEGCSFILKEYPAKTENFYLNCSYKGFLKLAEKLDYKTCCKNICGKEKQAILYIKGRVIEANLDKPIEERCKT